MTTQQLKAVATGEAQRRPKSIIDLLDDARVKNGLAAVAGKFLQPDRLLRLCTNAVRKTPLLLKCDPQTVLGAMMTTAALGLEPNTVQQLAFLIPYSRRVKIGGDWTSIYECQFQIGARGFVTLAYRSPLVKSLEAHAIHANDVWEHMVGTESFLRYSKAMRDRGDLIGSFSYVRLASGAETACVLPLEEIYKIRGKSEAWRQAQANLLAASSEREQQKAQAKLDETPWGMWEDDMAAKSAIKKHAKQLPIASSDLLIAASEIDSQGEMGRLNLKQMADPDALRAVVEGDLDAPALEHDPADTLDFPATQDERETVQVPVGAAGAAAAANKSAPPAIDPADRPDTGARDAGGDEPPQRQEPREHAAAPAAGKGDAAPRVSYARLADRLVKAGQDREVAELIMDEGRALPERQQRELRALFDQQFPADPQ
jgi:recombination protein RecT